MSKNALSMARAGRWLAHRLEQMIRSNQAVVYCHPKFFLSYQHEAGVRERLVMMGIYIAAWTFWMPGPAG